MDLTTLGLKKPLVTEAYDLQIVNDNADKVNELITADRAQINSLALFHRLSFTRDLTLAGVQNIVMPWEAKAILFYATVNVSKKLSIGQVIKGIGGGAVATATDGNVYRENAPSIAMFESGGAFTLGAVTINSNSIDINWTKTGTGATGTATVYALAMR